MSDNDLDGRLRAWGEGERSAYGEAEVPVQRLVRPSRRTGWAVAGTVALVAAVGVTIGVANLGRPHHSGGGPAASGASTTAPIPARYADLILRNGDSVRATGFVMALPGHSVRFCAPSPVPLVGGRTPAQMAKLECGFSVPTTGIDLASLSMRRADGGVVTGTATLTGVWRHGTLDVSATSPPGPRNGSGTSSSVPCTAPAHGWPRGPANQNLDVGPAQRYGRAHPGAIVQVALLRPSATQVIAYVLTSGDPAPVRAALRADFHGRVCVVRSDYTLDQIHAALAGLRAAQGARASRIYDSGQGLSASEQVQIQVGLTLVTPAVAREAAASPAGLIQLNPFLVPLKR